MLRDWWKQEVSSRWRKSRRLSTSQATQDLQVEVVQRKGWAAHDTPEVSISKECLSIAIIDSEYFQMLYISQNLTCHVHPSCIVHASTCLFWNNLAFDCAHTWKVRSDLRKRLCVWKRLCVCDLCAVFGTFVMPIDEELAQASNARKPKNMVASPQYQHIYTMQLFTLLEQFNKGDRLEHRTQEFPKDLWKVKPFNHDAVSCKQGSRDCSQWKSCCETNRPQNLQRACKKLWYRERMRKWPYKALELRCAAWVPWLARLTRLASWRRRIHTCKPS